MWAYSRGEFKVLVNPDRFFFCGFVFGFGFRVVISRSQFSQISGARPWGASSRSEASFAEQVMLAAPMNILAITIVMREPQAWNVEPGPSMLVSGVTSPRDSRCAISSGVLSSSCAGAISSGDGRGIFSACRTAMTFQVGSIDQLTLPTPFRRCVSVEASAAPACHDTQKVIGSDESSCWASAFVGSAIDLTVLFKSAQRVDTI